MSLRNKAIYDLVTTFLFVMVIVFTVLAIIFIGKYVAMNTADSNDLANRYEDVSDAKGRLLSADCYGLVIDENKANETCAMPEGSIMGYVIEMPAYGNCSDDNKTWSHMLSDEGSGQVSSYFVPIRSMNNLVCPGKLKVIY